MIEYMADRAKINDLLRQACRGDDGAFGRLADEVQDDLFRLALGLGEAEAAEVVQETLLRAFVGRRRLQAGADGMSWLAAIAVNVVRERRRWRWRREKAGAIARRLRPPLSDAQAGRDEPERLESLAAAVAKLPPRQREAVTCRFLLRMSIRQTAEAMDCAEGTVKSAVASALETLRVALGYQE